MSQDTTFYEWVAAHDGILWKVARAYASWDDANELHQDILIAVWRAVPLYRSESKVSTFLYRIALNSAMNWRRNQQRYDRRHVPLEELAAAVPEVKTERTELLYSVLAELSEGERSLALMYLDELSYREIAEVLGITESNVGVKLNRIKKRLSELLEARK